MLRNDICRIIDANINHASEALRVLEDWARYSKDDKQISGKLKKIRHSINDLSSRCSNFVMSRESDLDVGKNIENNSRRNSVRDIIRANCKRFEEAMRVLSEYGQLVETSRWGVSEFENNRYEIYTIEKELLKNEKLLRLYNAKLYLVTNRDGFKSDRDFLNVIEQSVSGGVDIIQLREKNENETKILSLAKEIKSIISDAEVLFIINDRVDLALACDADGVHLGQDDLSVSEARKITPEGFIIGLSTHNIEQGKIIHELPLRADYLGVGPVFPTPTKLDYKAAGLEYVSWAKDNLKNIPWFAIGGIDEGNINKVIDAGAERIAVVRAIMNSTDSKIITKELKKRVINEDLPKGKSECRKGVTAK